MVDVFVIKLLLAFTICAVWITGATVLAEKLGSKIGGLFAGIPSTTLIALFLSVGRIRLTLLLHQRR